MPGTGRGSPVLLSFRPVAGWRRPLKPECLQVSRLSALAGRRHAAPPHLLDELSLEKELNNGSAEALGQRPTLLGRGQIRLLQQAGFRRKALKRAGNACAQNVECDPWVALCFAIRTDNESTRSQPTKRLKTHAKANCGTFWIQPLDLNALRRDFRLISLVLSPLRVLMVLGHHLHIMLYPALTTCQVKEIAIGYVRCIWCDTLMESSRSAPRMRNQLAA